MTVPPTKVEGDTEANGPTADAPRISRDPLIDAEVIGYVRVSSDQQANSGDSISAQRSAIQKYATEHKLGRIPFIEDPGFSGKDDKRPGFKKLAALALAKGTCLKTIIVFDTSRFFRNFIYAEWYQAEFRKNGVRIEFVSDRFADDENGTLLRQITGISNELLRKKNAIHVRNSMLSNAEKGFWNGARPVLGYKTEIAEMRGDTAKKRLVVDPVGAELVRKIFDLSINGENGEGPLGIKAICRWVNERGYRTSTGRPFMVGTIEHLLKNEAYVGRMWWNKVDPETKKERPRIEWILYPCEPVLTEEVFQAAQLGLRARAPKITAPRITNSPVLLTGLAYCECGAKLQIQTATGRSKTYRYYSCSAHMKGRGCTLDKPTRINEADLDAVVTKVVLDHLLNAHFVQSLSTRMANKFAATTDDISRNLVLLKRQLATAKSRLARLIDGFADGKLDGGDVFQEAQRKARQDCNQLEALVAGEERLAQRVPIELDSVAASAAVEPIRRQIENAPVKTRKRTLQTLLSLVVVRPLSIEIIGSEAGLAGLTPSGSVETMVRSELPVRSSDREWWSLAESNR